jgi:hypothetical protein
VQQSQREHHEEHFERSVDDRLSGAEADHDALRRPAKHGREPGPQLSQEVRPLRRLRRPVTWNLEDERCRPEIECAGERKDRRRAAECQEYTADCRPGEHSDARDGVADHIRGRELVGGVHQRGHQCSLRRVVRDADYG